MSIKRKTDHLFVVILCGGGGKRLWPRSRRAAPKQFIKLFGKKTIFQKTVERLESFVASKHLFVVTNSDYIDEVRDQAPQIPRENIIAEPEAKNTAMAVGLGTVYIKRRDPEAVIINLPSDHFVEDIKRFQEALLVAAEASFSGEFLVTVGIKPTIPHTGLGYIKISKIWKKFGGKDVFRVEKFTEKPNLATAKKFIESGQYLWNAGFYIFKISALLKALAKHSPETSSLLKKIEMAIGKKNEKMVLKEAYQKAQDISIDYAVAERAENMLVVPGEFGWSDIGDWKVVYDVSPKDKNSNVVIFEGKKGEFFGVDTTNCLIHLSDQLVAAVGVKDLVIIDTPDAVLVVDKKRAEEVKKLVKLLESKGRLEHL